MQTTRKAFNTLYKQKTYKPDDLLKVPEFRAVVEEMSHIFSTAIPHETPAEMKAYLEKDAFVFSGLKAHAQLAEARSYLKDENGNIRPYYQFERDVLKLNETYNKNYLKTEYNFAVHSAQSAANWANHQNDESRYWLEYRVTGINTRPTHQAMSGICLPKSDTFWTEFYPPNGWECHCWATDVLAREKTLSDSQKAIEAGQKATTQIGKNGKNKLEMFRFNPGIEKKMFPPKNTYTKVAGAEQIKKAINKTIIPKGLLEVEEKFGVKVPRELLNHLEIDNFIVTNNNNERTYYTNIGVKKLNVQDWTFKNGYQKNNILVHELGHAIDYQKGLAERPEVKSLMDKYRDKYSANRNKLYKHLDRATKATVENKTGNEEWIDQASDYLDILMALNPKYGAGHSKVYYSGKLKPEREFIAHCFQLKYNGTGNRFIKRVDSDLHDDMIKLLDEILK